MMKRPLQVYSDPPSSLHFPCTSVLIEQATTANWPDWRVRREKRNGERRSKEQRRRKASRLRGENRAWRHKQSGSIFGCNHGCHLTDDVVLVVLDEFQRYATGKTKPASTTSHTHHPCPHNPLLPLPSPSLPLHHHHNPPPTPAVHTLRPPLNVGPAYTFKAVAPFTNHRV